MSFIKINEFIGATTGILGALLIALNMNMEIFGFLLYIVSDACWIYVGAKKGMTSLLVMSVVFGVIGIVGIINWMQE